MQGNSIAIALQCDVTWWKCMLVFIVDETGIILQLFSSEWPIVVAVSFQEAYFYHGIIACHSVAWLQNTHFVVVPNSCRLHSSSTLITEIDTFSRTSMIYTGKVSEVLYIKHLMVGKLVKNYWELCGKKW
jgi:hypothetical protein